MNQRLFYVDRIEGGVAILQEKDEEDKTREVPRKSLPRGAKAGCWIREKTDTIADNTRYVLDKEETRAAKARVQSLMDELSR